MFKTFERLNLKPSLLNLEVVGRKKEMLKQI